MSANTILIAAADQGCIQALEALLPTFQFEQVPDRAGLRSRLEHKYYVALLLDDTIVSDARALHQLLNLQRPAFILMICNQRNCVYWEKIIPEELDEYCASPCSAQRIARLINANLALQIRTAPGTLVQEHSDLADQQAGSFLAHSQWFLRRSQEVGRLGSYALDIVSGEWSSSPFLDRLFGLEGDYPHNVEGWLGLVLADDRQMMADYFKSEVLKQHRSFDKKYRIKRISDGQIRWVHGRGELVYSSGHELISMIGIIQDITEQVNNEHELKKLSYALQQSPASVIITDLDGHIEYVNAKFMEITGYSYNDISGQKPSILKSGEMSAGDYQVLWETILAGGTWQGEFHNKRKDGTLYWEWAVISPIHDTTGKITQFVAVKEDITARKLNSHREQMLQTQLQRALRMEAIATMAGGIAHDFNNILQSMYLYLGMAMDAIKDEEVLSDLGQVADAGFRAQKLIKQILAFSRHTELSKQEIQIQYIIKETLKNLKHNYPRTVKLQYDIDTNCAPVNCDPTQIHQIITNLVTNAYAALPNQTGVIEVSLQQTEVNSDRDRDIHLPDGQYALLKVSDSGQGMTPDILEHIFDPFFSTRDLGHGSGLGLSVVYGLVEELAGQILVSSKFKLGTTFTILLPVITTETKQLANHSNYAALDLSTLSIIHLDQDDAVLSGTRLKLEEYACHVVSCVDGDDLLNLMQRYPETFGLALIDQDIEDQDLHELLATIKGIRQDLPIILTGSGHTRSVESLKKADLIDAVLTKPWQIDDLLSLVVLLLPEISLATLIHEAAEDQV